MLEKIREFLKRIYCNSACCGSTLTVEMTKDKEDEGVEKKDKRGEHAERSKSVKLEQEESKKDE